MTSIEKVRGNRSSFVGWIAAAVLAAPSAALAAEIPSGADIGDGLSVHVSPKGIDFLETQVQYVIPPSVSVPNQGGRLFSCLLDTCDWRLMNTVVYLDVGKVSLTPQEGRLDLHLELYVSANGRVETNGCLFNNGCNVYVAPSLVVADTTIEMNLVPDGTGRYDVDAETEAFAIGLSLGNPNISSCALGDFFEFFVELFLGTIEDAVVDVLQDEVRPLIEPAVEDAFNSLNIAGTLDLAGVPIDYDFFPTALEIHPGTVGLVMGGHFATPEAADCVDATIGSTVTVGAVPSYGATSPAGSQYQVAASINDDILNQLLFSAWRGGLLCQEVGAVGDSELDSSMLELIGGSLGTILTEDGALALRIRAPTPPLATMGGPNGETATISLADLEVDVLADVEGRMARIFGLQLSPTAGVTLEINAQGQLVPTLNFDPAQLEPELVYNELAPDANATVMNLLPTLVEQLLPELTDAIPTIDLPDLGGLVLESAEFTPDGPAGDHLSVYATFGGQVQAGGCGAIPGGGCGVDGGGLGCSLAGSKKRGSAATFLASPAMLMIGIGALLARRRREG